MALPFKAVAVDMDGTFLDEHKQYNQSEFATILAQLEKRHVHFIVASGRPYARLKKDFGKFASRLDFVTLNGSRLIIDDQQVAVYPLNREDALQLIQNVSGQYGPLTTMVFENQVAYLSDRIPAEQRQFLTYFAGKSALVNDWQKLPSRDILQVTFNLNSQKAKSIEKDFNQNHQHQIAAFASASEAIDINQAGINKGSGLKHLLAKLSLTGEDLIAFGDGGNDIDMLDLAKYSYAMANGMPQVKKHARFIAPPNTTDGVFHVLNKYLKS